MIWILLQIACLIYLGGSSLYWSFKHTELENRYNKLADDYNDLVDEHNDSIFILLDKD